jgi:hypothetical protein
MLMEEFDKSVKCKAALTFTGFVRAPGTNCMIWRVGKEVYWSFAVHYCAVARHGSPRAEVAVGRCCPRAGGPSPPQGDLARR